MIFKTWFLVTFALCGLCANAFAVDLRVNGEPPLGAFGVDTVEHIHECAKLGMNLVYTYKADFGKRQLDLNDPAGKAVAEHRMKVMYILASRFTRVRLAKDIAPGDTTIPVIGMESKSMEAFPESGALNIEGEKIAYAARTMDAFTGCKRGVEGTKPAAHGARLLLCNSEKLKEEILAVKDSPNLWGFWQVDDARPNEGDSLREMARVIRQYDRRADGTPYNHVIVMGVGGMVAMGNFSPGCCDALGIYLYPYRKGKLDQGTRRQLGYIAARAKSLQPDIGLIGVYQAFAEETSQSWKDMPKPEEVREDILAYMQCGAVGAMGFIYHWQRPKGKPFGFSAWPEVCAAVAKVYDEIRTGQVKPGQPSLPKVEEWFQARMGPDAAPSAGIPIFDISDPKKMEQLTKAHVKGRITPEPFETGGHKYLARMSVPMYKKGDPDAQRWPGVTFRIEAKVLDFTDWSSFRYLEQPLYNPMDHTIALRLWLADSEGGGWENFGVPIPPRTPVLLRLPITEAALSANLQKVRHWMLWFNEPGEDITLYLGNPVLVGKRE